VQAWLALIAMTALAATARAQTPSDVRIDISSGEGRRIRIHCEALQAAGDRTAGSWSVQADEVLAHDLDWSAVFTVSRGWVAGQQPVEVQAVVGGRFTVSGNQVRMAGEVRDSRRGGRSSRAVPPRSGLALAAHQFADDIVLQFTGELGVSQTRIAFIAQTGKVKELYVMDYDGARVTPLTSDQSLASSPGWSPEGSLLLFTSYRGGAGPRLFVIAASGGKPFLVSGRPGINTCGSYSPDGRQVVCALSFEGNSEIYLLDARGASAQRLTNSRGIDTSPTWSPTGREIAFTSDRTGTPQVHVMDREGGNQRRLDFDVDYTDSPAWSPKGDRIAFVVRSGGGFDIYTCQPTGETRGWW
jgi:TolB protein